MNQYTTKIWKYDSDNLSTIQFEFLNGVQHLLLSGEKGMVRG